MKLLDVTFGSTVRFDSAEHTSIRAERNGVDIRYEKGFVVLRKGTEVRGVFPTNVRYFTPAPVENAPTVEELFAKVDSEEEQLTTERKKPGRKPKTQVNE